MPSAQALDELWQQLAPSDAGLVAAIVVHAEDGRVLMLGYMSREALAATLETAKVTFFSRSKQRLWQKGESSGNTLDLETIRVDCDGDALLVEAHPRGPTCHTGATSCFYRELELESGRLLEADDGPPPPALDLLWRTILARKSGEGMTNRAGESYVRRLLDKGVPKISSKIREEAEELCVALADEDDARVASEAADLLFHALVGLAARAVPPGAVAEVIRERHGQSGIDEKAARSERPPETSPK